MDVVAARRSVFETSGPVAPGAGLRRDGGRILHDVDQHLQEPDAVA